MNYCEERDGHLAYIESQEENDIIQHTLNSSWDSGAWLGLYSQTYNQQNQRGFTAWLNGANLEYTNWAPGEPYFRFSGTEAGEMLPNGTWNTIDRLNGNHFICEIPNNLIGNHLYV